MQIKLIDMVSSVSSALDYLKVATCELRQRPEIEQNIRTYFAATGQIRALYFLLKDAKCTDEDEDMIFKHIWHCINQVHCAIYREPTDDLVVRVRIFSVYCRTLLRSLLRDEQKRERGVKAVTIKTTIDFKRFTDEEQEAYAEAWKDAGGTMLDAECASPWCCPWLWAGTGTFDLDLPPDYSMDDVARAMLSEYPEAAAERDQDWLCEAEEEEKEDQ